MQREQRAGRVWVHHGWQLDDVLHWGLHVHTLDSHFKNTSDSPHTVGSAATLPTADVHVWLQGAPIWAMPPQPEQRALCARVACLPASTSPCNHHPPSHFQLTPRSTHPLQSPMLRQGIVVISGTPSADLGADTLGRGPHSGRVSWCQQAMLQVQAGCGRGGVEGSAPLDVVLGDAGGHDVCLVAAPPRLAHLAHLQGTQHCPIRHADSKLSGVKPIGLVAAPPGLAHLQGTQHRPIRCADSKAHSIALSGMLTAS